MSIIETQFNELKTLINSLKYTRSQNNELYDLSDTRSRPILLDYYLLGQAVIAIYEQFKQNVHERNLTTQYTSWLTTQNALFEEINLLGTTLGALQKTELDMSLAIFEDELERTNDLEPAFKNLFTAAVLITNTLIENISATNSPRR